MKKRGWTLFTILVAVAVAPLVLAVATPPDRSYSFVPDHPISMWQDGGDKWVYYGAGGAPADLIQKARPVLVAQGFQEDATKRPWFRFVKGDEEVIVCDHNEFAVNQGLPGGGKLIKGIGGKPQNYASVLVKNGLGTHQSVGLFQIKKLLLRW